MLYLAISKTTRMDGNAQKGAVGSSAVRARRMTVAGSLALLLAAFLALCLTAAGGAALSERAYADDQEAQLAPPAKTGRGTGSFEVEGQNATKRITPAADASAPARPEGVQRLQGERALDTMVAIVKAGNFQPGGTVVLAQLEGYWDALTAAGIAGLLDSPVLMTPSSGLAEQTKGLLEQLRPSKIIVCGGENSVPKATVDTAARAAGTSPEVVRCSGDTATETATDIYQQGSDGKGSGWSETAIIATVGTFQDALAAAPVAYALHMPVFLAEYDWDLEEGTLSRGTIVAMKMGGVKTAYIAGGEYWISSEVEGQLEEAGIECGGRLAGRTAVQTSEAVAAFGLERGMSLDAPGFATVNSYYDALCGAALCGRSNSVMLLVDDEASSSITGFAADRACAIPGAWIFGGEGAVSAATGNAVAKVLREGGDHEWVADAGAAGVYRCKRCGLAGHYEDVYETVHVPAVTHEEPVYETVVDQEAYTTYTTVFSTHDGWSSTDRDAARAHQLEVGGHLAWENIEEYHPAVTHQEQTGTTTVVDQEAYDEQRKVGTTWVVDVAGVSNASLNRTWVPEKGHWEPVYTTVVDQEAYTTTTIIYYCADGYSTTDRAAWRAHALDVGGNSWAESVDEYHPAVTHQEQTGKYWVVDTPGHWE